MGKCRSVNLTIMHKLCHLKKDFLRISKLGNYQLFLEHLKRFCPITFFKGYILPIRTGEYFLVGAVVVSSFGGLIGIVPALSSSVSKRVYYLLSSDCRKCLDWIWIYLSGRMVSTGNFRFLKLASIEDEWVKVGLSIAECRLTPYRAGMTVRVSSLDLRPIFLYIQLIPSEVLFYH